MAERRPPALLVAGPVLIERVEDVLWLDPDREGLRPRLVVGRREPFVGGAAVRAAVAATGPAVRVDVAGIIGDDPGGRAARDLLTAHRIGTTALVAVPGSTGEERLLLDSAGGQLTDAITLLTNGYPRDAHVPPARAALATYRPGDALLLCGLTLGRDAELLDLAEDADLQIVGLLDPVPPLGRHPDAPVHGADLARLDVAVVDVAGAGQLADIGCLPAAVVVVTPTTATWDDVVVPAPGSRGSAPRLDAFAGRLAAALAVGDDREPALHAAWAAAVGGRPRGQPLAPPSTPPPLPSHPSPSGGP